MLDDKSRYPDTYQNYPLYLTYHDRDCPCRQYLIERYPTIEKGCCGEKGLRRC